MITRRFFIFTFAAFLLAEHMLQSQQQPATDPKKIATTVDTLKTADTIKTANQLAVAESARNIFVAWAEYVPETIDTCKGEKCLEFPAPTIPGLSEGIEKFYTGLIGTKKLPDSTPNIIKNIKAFYFYLEYCTKLETAAKLIAYALDQKYDAAALKSLVKTQNLGEKKNGWYALINNLFKVDTLDQVPAAARKKYEEAEPDQTAWDILLKECAGGDPLLKETCVGEMGNNFKDAGHFWQYLTQTTFWKALVITQEGLMQSSAWQDYTKYLTVNLLSSMGNLPCDELLVESTDKNKKPALAATGERVGLLDLRIQSAEAVFPYLPYLESAYYTSEFTEQRSQLELMQVSLLLSEHMLEHLKSTSDWKDLPLIGERKEKFTCPEDATHDLLGQAVACW